MKLTKVTPREDYLLDIEMDDTSKLIIDMKKNLNTIQFYPLKDEKVWNNIFIEEDAIFWKGLNGDVIAEMSLDTVMDIFGEEETESEGSGIERIDISEYVKVHIIMKNKNEAYLSMDRLAENLRWFFVW